jgi:glycosyltransferase involved in cell wall biosynthesis
MKACILAPYRVLPIVDGPTRRVAEISKGLSDAGVSVVLLHAGKTEFSDGGLQVVGFPALENLPVTRGFLWSRALDAYLSLWNPALCRALMRVVKKTKVDILQIEGPWGIFAAGLARALCGRLSIVYDAHNVESLASRFSSGAPWLWPYVALVEGEAARRSDAVLCVSESDKARMCGLYRVLPSKVFVVPNGVRIPRKGMDPRSRIRRRLGLETDTKIVFFHGLLSWRPNLEAVRAIVDSIAPDFEAEDQGTVFLVAGAHPPRGLMARASQRTNVRVLGYVPRVEEYIQAADVCIAPLKQGSGTRLKILEYFAAEKPVIATRKAVEGMGVRNGVEALVFDEVDEEFIDALRNSLNQVPLELCKNAGVMARLHDWSMVAAKISEIYESLE